MKAPMYEYGRKGMVIGEKNRATGPGATKLENLLKSENILK